VNAPIETSFITQFQANIALLVQQQGSRLRGTVMEGAHTGEAADFLEQFGVADSPAVDLPRNSDTPIMEVPQDRRWVYPQDIDWGTLIDSQDRLRMAIDPASPTAQAASATMSRKLDDVIIAGMLGTVRTGKTAQNSVAIPAGNVIANTVGAAVATGMNVAKLREARRLFKRAEIDPDYEVMYAGLCADKETDLFAEAQVTSLDFNTKPVLVDGRLTQFLGFQFVHSERFVGGSATTNGTPFEVPVWLKSGVHLGIWSDLSATADVRADKRYATQLYTKMTIGASRTEEARVLKILCI
jgi:hypothetical protein